MRRHRPFPRDPVSNNDHLRFRPSHIMNTDQASTCFDKAVKQMTVLKSARRFDSHTFLCTVGEGRHMLSFPRNDAIFAQGHASDGLFFIQQGNVLLSFKSEGGKKAT